MKNSLYLLSLISLLAVSCGPSKYTMHLETRYPSKVGVDLAGKNISVVYLENDDVIQNGFNASMAEGFASSLENEYETGKGSIGVYRMKRTASGDYSSRDTLRNLLMDTGVDVVFLFDTVAIGEISVGGSSRTSLSSVPDSAYISAASVPFTLKLYSYDAMDKKDEVRNFGGTTIAQPAVYSDGKQTYDLLKAEALSLLPAEGAEAGRLVAESFASQWKVEGFSICYFDSSKWIEAVRRAENFEWKAAMDIWFGFLDSNDLMKRSCAAYNLAVACFLQGDYRLASEWLDLSDKDNQLPLSEGLRKRIDQRLK